ncbi:MAG: type II CAAX endopeptidase family protein [Kiloniellales bacterium]|nr:type II CAAX endopeptidase family protein [Kiloniellales bacterium]
MSDATFDAGLAAAQPPQKRFWEQGRLGRSAPWLFALSLPLILVILLLGMLVAGMLLGAFDPSGIESLARGDWREQPLSTALFSFGFVMLPFVFLLMAVFLANRLVHGRSPRSLLTGRARFRWSQTLSSLAVILVLALAVLAAGRLLSPEAVVFVLDPQAFLLFLPLVLILVPIQVLSEEVFFRGYLVQAIGRFFTRPWAAILLPTLLFWGAHLNNGPVLQGGLWAVAVYGIMAFYLTFLAVTGDGLEHPLGVHLGINLFAFLIQGAAGDGYRTPTVFVTEPEGYEFTLFATVVIFAVHYVLVVRPGRGAGPA